MTTSFKPHLYSVESFESDMKYLCLKFPGNTNPCNRTGSCIYSTEYDGSGKHCLIGQFLKMKGLPVPGPHVTEGAVSILPCLGFTEEVTSVAIDWQARADALVLEGREMVSVKWGSLL